MKVLIYHPVILPVSHYGGTERVVMWLAQSLIKFGHKVTIFAAPGSNLQAPLECITEESELLTRAPEFSIVHGFTKMSQTLENAFNGKMITTIQGNGQKGERFHINTVFVSRNHAERHGASAFVYNGLDPSELKFLETSGLERPNRFLFLSKTSWKVKNLSGAYDLCAKYHQNLWVAGGEGPLWLKAKTQLRHFLGQDWKWVGSVNQAQKADFLVQGKAMLFPILWHEPFGIVMTESLVSGTPFFGPEYGSVPEILEFAPQCLMRTEKDWENALTNQIKMPKAKECRQWVLEKFDQITMAKKYLELYERVISGEKLNSTEPQTNVGALEI